MSAVETNAHGSPARRPVPRVTRSNRWAVASRAAAGILGGYGLAALFSVIAAVASRAPREDAVLIGTTPAFLIFVAALVWAFAAKTAWRAWLGVLAPAALLGTAYWILRYGAAAATAAVSS